MKPLYPVLNEKRELARVVSENPPTHALVTRDDVAELTALERVKLYNKLAGTSYNSVSISQLWRFLRP